MSSRTLSARLKTLEKNGIITRTVYPVIPPSVEYQLTPKGKDARKMFTAMIDWKNQW
nr:helix-turn-helix domain-containing protein [Fructilactobacillus sanfranciscensis]